MCKFFSLVSDGAGNIMYFDSAMRKKIMVGEVDYETDSHTSIADYHGFKGEDGDMLNKYEFNPLTKEFIIDQINNKDDSKEVEKNCHNLDFKKIVPELIIKPIVNPFGIKAGKVTKREIALLEDWINVGDSVRDSVGDSVRGSVWDSVGDSVRDSVGDSVGGSVWDSVGDSVWDSVRDYISSFFDISEFTKYKCCVDLWESGFVPSFDGKTWRLHAGKKAGIVYEKKD